MIRLRLIIGVSAIAVVLVLVVPSVALADGHGHREAASQVLIQKINNVRVDHGRGVVQNNLRARRLARHWVHEMIRYDNFEMALIPGHVNMQRFVWRFIPRGSRLGTIAMYRCGPGNNMTPQKVMHRLMRDAGLRQVVLMRGVRKIGIHWTKFGGGFNGDDGMCNLLALDLWGRT